MPPMAAPDAHGGVGMRAGTPQMQRPKAHRRRLLREAALVAGAYLAYFRVRGATEGDLATALQHADAVQTLERSLGIFVEPALQTAVLGKPWLVDLLNGLYLFGHWPVIVAAGIWLYTTRPQSYQLYRNAFLISGAIGLYFFFVFPTAPPRLAEFGLVDTVTERADIFRILQPRELTNQYAAFPSLHFGWNLLVGIALIQGSRRWSVRLLGLLSPLAMFAAIILTANHYLLDAAAGATVALIGLAAAHVLMTHQPHPVAALRNAAQGTLVVIRASTSAVIDEQMRVHIAARRAEAESRATHAPLN